MNLNQCPYCGAVVTKVRVEGVRAVVEGKVSLEAWTFGCSGCDKVLGIVVDPVTAAKQVEASRAS